MLLGLPVHGCTTAGPCQRHGWLGLRRADAGPSLRSVLEEHPESQRLWPGPRYERQNQGEGVSGSIAPPNPPVTPLGRHSERSSGAFLDPLPRFRLQQHRFLLYSCPAGLVPGSIMHASGLERMCQHGLWFWSRTKEAEEKNKQKEVSPWP